MTITIAGLLLILPVLVLTGTAVVAMSAIAVGRNYPVTAFITVVGFLLAALSAVTLMPDANQQNFPPDNYCLAHVLYSLAGPHPPNLGHDIKISRDGI